MAEVQARTLEAELDFDGMFDPGAMAAAVHDELGGESWRGEDCSQWPHDCWVELAQTPIRFITVVVARDGEMDGVLDRVEATLRRDPRWEVLSIRCRSVSDFESETAMDLVKLVRS
jgi:hypothetical protein